MANKKDLDALEFALGDDVIREWNDPLTLELMCNPDGSVWIEKAGSSPKLIGQMEAYNADNICRIVADSLGKTFSKDQPIIEGEWPIDGSRFEGLVPPIVASPSFTLRKKASMVFTLDQYVEQETMTPEQRRVLADAIREHANVLIVGGTGSGKTTLVNGLIDEVVKSFPNERMVIIEDTGEIQCAAKNAVQLHSTVTTSMTDLLKATLRLRPDRILVGEVRGPEALDLLMAWNTGHPGGLATVHANSASAGLDRLRLLISMNANAPKDSEILIGEAIDYVVFIARDLQKGRKLQEIIRVDGYDAVTKKYEFKSL